MTENDVDASSLNRDCNWHKRGIGIKFFTSPGSFPSFFNTSIDSILAANLSKIFSYTEDKIIPCSRNHHHVLELTRMNLYQGRAISGPRAKCDPPRRFQWPADAFRKDLQTYIAPTYTNISFNVSQ